MFKLHPTVHVLVFCVPSYVYFHRQSSSLAIRWDPICYLLFVMCSSWCIAAPRPRPHCTGEIWKRKFHSENASNVFNPTITGHLGFVFEENSGREITWLSWRHFFEQLRFQNAFRPRENEKPAFSTFCGSKSVLENIRFHEGLVWMIDLTGEINLCFQSVFCPRENEKPAFSNFCGSKSVLENMRFHDRSVWTDKPNRRNKAAFSNC